MSSTLHPRVGVERMTPGSAPNAFYLFCFWYSEELGSALGSSHPQHQNTCSGVHVLAHWALCLLLVLHLGTSPWCVVHVLPPLLIHPCASAPPCLGNSSHVHLHSGAHCSFTPTFQLVPVRQEFCLFSSCPCEAMSGALGLSQRVGVPCCPSPWFCLGAVACRHSVFAALLCFSHPVWRGWGVERVGWCSSSLLSILS